MVVSPDWLLRKGQPDDPQSLEGTYVLRLGLPGHRDVWRFARGSEAPFEVQVQGQVVMSSPLLLMFAARAGMGPALVADWLAAAELEAGNLVDLFPDYRATASEWETAAWAVYPSRRYVPGKVRAAIDFFRPRLRALSRA